MNGFEYIFRETLSDIMRSDADVLVIPGSINTEDDLLRCYFDQTKADYMGQTWDSLDEVISDPLWASHATVWIVHNGIPSLSTVDLKMYLTILARALSDTKRETQLHVAFIVDDEADRAVVANRLNILTSIKK